MHELDPLPPMPPLSTEKVVMRARDMGRGEPLAILDPPHEEVDQNRSMRRTWDFSEQPRDWHGRYTFKRYTWWERWQKWVAERERKRRHKRSTNSIARRSR